MPLEFDPSTAVPDGFDAASASPDLTDEEVVSGLRQGKAVGVGNFLRVAGKRLLAPYSQDGQQHPAYRQQAMEGAFSGEARLPGDIPKLEAKGGTVEQIGRGVYNVGAELINALPSAGTASVLTSPASAAFVGGNLLLDAFMGAPEAGRAVVDPKSSTTDATAAVVGTLLSGAGSVAGLKPIAKYAKGLQDARAANESAARKTQVLAENQDLLVDQFRQKSALDAQQVEMETLRANQVRVDDFLRARAEEVEQQVREQQIKPTETTILEKDALRQAATMQLDKLTEGGFVAAKERSRLQHAANENSRPSVDDGSIPESVDMSAQAQRMMDEHGAINAATLSAIGQMSTGAAGGYAWGYFKGKELPEKERVANALQWAVFGGVLGSPLRGVVARSISNVRIPTGSGSRFFAGAENFYLFPKTVLKEVHEALRGERAETDALAMGALRAYDALDTLMPKATVGDRTMVGSFLRGATSSGNIFDPQLKLAAEKVRASIDDFTLDLKGMGIIEPGTALDVTTTHNLGAYLTRAYRAFEVPNFKPETADINAFVGEYIKDQLLNRSTAPVDQLRQEGYETALRMVAKGQGGAMENAAQFALGNGIARTKGEIFQPRKALTDATRKLLGEIDDPVQAAGQTINRMAHYIGASITQGKMRETGLALGLFSEKATPAHTVPMTVGGETPSRGPLANLWVLPEAADALKSDAAYHQNGLAWRALATASAYSKISKTVGNVVSYAPNFWSAWLNLMSQGAGAVTVFNPGKVADAIRVTFDDVLPSTRATIQRDAEFLTREQLLRQNVNLNDLVGHMRLVLGPTPASVIGKSSNAVVKGARKVGSGIMNAYGKFEEAPRILGFYAEVERYRKVFPRATESELYDRAAKVTRAVFPNAAETPDFVRKLSLTGLGNPFISWTHETFWRNPYNTMQVAKADIAEGLATGNKRLVAAGANRAAWWTGTVAGAIAINEALRSRNGVSDRQEEAIKRIVPQWDKRGLLLIRELTPQQLAYANQNYLVPQSIPAAAIKAALSGTSPTDAAAEFTKEFVSNYYGDGGTLIGPAIQAFTGRNDFGRQLYTQDAGKYVNTAGIKNPNAQELSIKAQQGLERLADFANKAYMPGTVNEAVKWKRAMNEEVGPDGQLYDKGDLARRLGGYRLNRLDVPKQFARLGHDFGGRLREIGTQFTRVLNQPTSKPSDVENAYQIQEAGRQRVYNDVKTYLQDGVELSQKQSDMIAHLQKGGVSTELILGALSGYYVPGKKDKKPTLQERFDSLVALPEAEKQAAWGALMKDEPLVAKAMIPQFKKEVRNLTNEDKLLGGLAIDDGTRARNVARLIMMEPNENQKKALYRYYQEHRIVTPAVMMQLADPQIWAQAKSAAKGLQEASP